MAVAPLQGPLSSPTPVGDDPRPITPLYVTLCAELDQTPEGWVWPLDDRPSTAHPRAWTAERLAGRWADPALIPSFVIPETK